MNVKLSTLFSILVTIFNANNSQTTVNGQLLTRAGCTKLMPTSLELLIAANGQALVGGAYAGNVRLAAIMMCQAARRLPYRM